MVIVDVCIGSESIYDAITAGISFIIVLIVAWLATGNGMDSLLDYFRHSAAIAGGYASSMQLEMGRTDEWWYAAIVLVILAALTALFVRPIQKREQAGVVLVVIGYAWWGLKEGFVRHDGHDLIFFASMLVALAIFGFSSSRIRSFYIATVACVAVFTWTAAGFVPGNLLSLAADAHGFGTQIHTIISSRLRTATINGARAQMQNAYALSPQMVSELDNHTVAIEPWENSVAWAYPRIHWDPEPVLQAYSAYTASLDAQDSDFLASSMAPARILEQPPTAIDGRDPTFEPPTTFVTALCHYIQLDASPTWQVLRRVHDRCGPTRPIARVTATFGQTVKVPVGPPGTMVVARLQSVPLPITYKLFSLVLKPPILFMNTPGAKYRFITGTAGDLHLLRTTPSIGYDAPFMPPTISSFTLSGAFISPNTGRFVVSFYSIRISAS
jgi:hypothetical protein